MENLEKHKRREQDHHVERDLVAKDRQSQTRLCHSIAHIFVQ